RTPLHLSSPHFPYTTLFRSVDLCDVDVVGRPDDADGGDHVADTVERRGEQTTTFPDANGHRGRGYLDFGDVLRSLCARDGAHERDRKSTRLNSSHVSISYAV